MANDVYYSALHYAAKAKKSEEKAENEADRAKGYADSINPDSFLDKTQITNCITEIPQDIKLELNNGTLTLKAGSKVYMPNGFEADGITPKFDEVVIASDTSLTPTGFANGVHTIFFMDGVALGGNITASEVFSGNTAPVVTGQYNLWYDTANNIMKRTTDKGVTWIPEQSLPIGLCNIANNSFASIDQVFNGFGYIGSTVFALPNVKGLIPNGRNADGSLKNVEFVTDNILTYTNPNKYIRKYIVTFDLLQRLRIYENVYYGYDEYKNIHIDTYSNKEVTNIPVASILTDSNGVITSFSPKTAFQALDYNDSSWIAAQGMPSERYIDLTLGASGTTYTAPANGEVCMRARIDGTWGQAYIHRVEKDGTVTIGSYTIGADTSWSNQSVPPLLLKKGDVFALSYNRATPIMFRFYYAEGEN